MMTTWSQSDTTVGFSAWPPSPPLTLHAQPPPFDPRHHNDYQAAIHVSHDVRWNSPRCAESPNCGLIVVAEQQQQKQNSSLRIANSRIMRRRNNVVDMQNSYFEQDLQFCEANYETYQNDNSMPTTTNHLINLDSSSCDSDELFSLDSMMNCDITSLDAFVHDNESSSFTTQSTSNIINSPDMTTSPSTVEDEDPVDEFFPQLTHRNKITTKKSSDYRLKRDKNNISSQKSRAKRQAIVMAQKEEKEKLEIQQIKLKAMVKSLEEQVEDYKRMVMMFVHSK